MDQEQIERNNGFMFDTAVQMRRSGDYQRAHKLLSTLVERAPSEPKYQKELKKLERQMARRQPDDASPSQSKKFESPFAAEDRKAAAQKAKVEREKVRKEKAAQKAVENETEVEAPRRAPAQIKGKGKSLRLPLLFAFLLLAGASVGAYHMQEEAPILTTHQVDKKPYQKYLMISEAKKADQNQTLYIRTHSKRWEKLNAMQRTNRLNAIYELAKKEGFKSVLLRNETNKRLAVVRMGRVRIL